VSPLTVWERIAGAQKGLGVKLGLSFVITWPLIESKPPFQVAYDTGARRQTQASAMHMTVASPNGARAGYT
jgi:hypothetical protein